jgi:hypothetical protein
MRKIDYPPKFTQLLWGGEEAKKLLKQNLRLAEDLAELATKSRLKNKGNW